MNFEQNNKDEDFSNTDKQTNSLISEEPEQPSQDKNQSFGSYIREVIKFFILAVVVVMPIRFFVAQPFIVQGHSMDKTFATGEYLIVDEISYRFNKPERGDVIVLHYPRNTNIFFIKRIIGLPGETLTIKNGKVSISEKENSTPLVLDEPYVTFLKTDGTDDEVVVLGEGEYFVMGDNRASSSDSREWGILPENLIVGKTFLRLFPFDTVSFSPGQNF